MATAASCSTVPAGSPVMIVAFRMTVETKIDVRGRSLAVRLLQKVFMRCRAGRITERAMNQAEPYAHLCELNSDGLRVQDRGAGRFLELERINDVRDELAAQRNNAFCALVSDQFPHEFDG